MSSLLCTEEEQRSLRKKEVFQNNVDLLKVRVWVKQKEEVDSLEKDKPCLIKIMTPLPSSK